MWHLIRRAFANSIYSNINGRIRKTKLIISEINQVGWEFAHIRDLNRTQYNKAIESLNKMTCTFKASPFVILDVRDLDEDTYEPLPAMNSVR